MSYLEVKNISKKIKRNSILNDISFSLEKGSINCLLGPNGSGKTMLLRALCGLIRIDSGEISVEGKNVIFNEKLPENIGIIIENTDFLPNRTGYENLKLLADINGNFNPKIIDKLLKDFDLYDKKDVYVKEYSLGMKKKLEIIQSIMEDQNLILLDEPTNALDEKSIEKFLYILKELKGEGKTFIIATHNRYVAEKISDKIVFISDGKIERIVENED